MIDYRVRAQAAQHYAKGMNERVKVVIGGVPLVYSPDGVEVDPPKESKVFEFICGAVMAIILAGVVRMVVG